MNKRSIHILTSWMALISCGLMLQASDSKSCPAVNAAQSINTKVYFRQGNDIIEPSYMDNELHLSNFIDNITNNPFCHLDSITIHSGASPEGSYPFNRNLSHNRGISLLNILKSRLSIADSCIAVDEIGEDWAGLRHLTTLYDTPYKDGVINIIDGFLDDTQNIDRNDSARISTLSEQAKSKLAKLQYGSAKDWISANIFPYLRCAHVEAHFHTVPSYRQYTDSYRIQHETDTVYIVSTTPDDTTPNIDYVNDTLMAGQENSGNKYRFAVKTNLLSDALLCPNIGLEFPIDRNMSIMAGYIFPWYTFQNDHYACQITQFSLEWRWWFKPRNVLSGCYLGLYGSYGKGDLQWKGEGCQCQRYWSTGLSTGYGFTIGRNGNLRLDIGLSIGYAPVKYDHYVYSETHGKLLYNDSGKKLWIGPTALKCSLAWIIPGNSKESRTNK